MTYLLDNDGRNTLAAIAKYQIKPAPIHERTWRRILLAKQHVLQEWEFVSLRAGFRLELNDLGYRRIVE